MKDMRSQLRDWLAEICPKGKPEDYCQIMANSAKPEVMKVRLFTHDYQYTIIANELEREPPILKCAAMRRKSLAGASIIEYKTLVIGNFNRVTWELVKASILRFELVKIVAEAREKR